MAWRTLTDKIPYEYHGKDGEKEVKYKGRTIRFDGYYEAPDGRKKVIEVVEKYF